MRLFVVLATIILASPAIAQPAYVPVVLDEAKMNSLLNALDDISMPAKARNQIHALLRELVQQAAAEKARAAPPEKKE